MVGQLTLDQPVVVRIHVREPVSGMGVGRCSIPIFCALAPFFLSRCAFTSTSEICLIPTTVGKPFAPMKYLVSVVPTPFVLTSSNPPQMSWSS